MDRRIHGIPLQRHNFQVIIRSGLLIEVVQSYLQHLDLPVFI